MRATLGQINLHGAFTEVNAIPRYVTLLLLLLLLCVLLPSTRSFSFRLCNRYIYSLRNREIILQKFLDSFTLRNTIFIRFVIVSYLFSVPGFLLNLIVVFNHFHSLKLFRCIPNFQQTFWRNKISESWFLKPHKRHVLMVKCSRSFYGKIKLILGVIQLYYYLFL